MSRPEDLNGKTFPHGFLDCTAYKDCLQALTGCFFTILLRMLIFLGGLK